MGWLSLSDVLYVYWISEKEECGCVTSLNCAGPERKCDDG